MSGRVAKASVLASLVILAFSLLALAVLNLGPPSYGECGRVTIPGYVSDNPDHMTWDWGDGTVTQAWFPATHIYAANGTYTVTVTAFPSVETTSTPVTISNAGGATCSHRVLVTPTWVLLHDGTTSRQLEVEIRDAMGMVLDSNGFDITFESDNPTIIAVDSGGLVSGTGFGRAWITVHVDGIAIPGKARAVAGKYWVEPAVLYLSVAGENTAGTVTAHAENANGTSRTVSTAFSGGNHVAAIDPVAGVVTAAIPPTLFSDSPYMRAASGGVWSDNATFVRVTDSDLELNPVAHVGQRIAIWTPDEFCGDPYGPLVTNLQAVDVVDGMYTLQQWLTDVTPFDGEVRRLILDPGIDADGTVPCGSSGNPVRLGAGVDNCRSCFGGDDWLHWGVMGHELGHDFMTQVSFQEFCSLLRDGGDTYNEGMATMMGIYAIDAMIDDPGTYGLNPVTVENLARTSIFLGPNFARTIFYGELEAYEASPDYSLFTANHLDAIMTQLHDEFGPSFLYRFLSAFFPPHSELPIPMTTEAEALSFWAAACSTAAGMDLLGRFTDLWDFPLDETFYHEILPQVHGLVIQRGPLLPHEEETSAVFRVDNAGNVLADQGFHAAAFESGAADIAEWVHITTSADFADVVEFDPIAPGQYRVAEDPCSSLVAGVISTAPGVTLGGSLVAPERALLALTGIVPVKVTNEGGPIQPGDLLVTSSTPGHAMRWAGSEQCPCSLVGKALEPMVDEIGVILVLLTAH